MRSIWSIIALTCLLVMFLMASFRRPLRNRPPKMEADDQPTEELVAAAVHRSRGSTASERVLADLGDQAFLNLWSYPNLFYDKKKGGKGDGKELCDMLAVCGDDVIIFSDKHIKYQGDKPVQIAWPRFYRKAIKDGCGSNQRRQQLDEPLPRENLH